MASTTAAGGNMLGAPRRFSTGVLAIVLVMLVVGATAVLLQAHATNFDCFGRSANYGVTVPTTVAAGSNFSVSDITGASDTLGTTVTSSTVAMTATGATPTSFSKTWTGSATGSFVADYGSQTLAATGAAGSTIKIKINSVTSEITGLGSFSCSVSNGQLTAKQAGESLVLATINVTAPQQTTTGSSGGQSATGTPGGSVTVTHSAPAKLTPQSAGTSSAPSSNTAGQSASGVVTAEASSYDITVKVVDSGNRLLPGAQVVLDHTAPATTNSFGAAVLSAVLPGPHSLTVTASGHSSTQQISVASAATAPQQFEVRVAAIHSSSRLPLVIFGFVVVVLIGLIFLVRRLLRHHLATTGATAILPAHRPVPPPTVIYPDRPIERAAPPTAPPSGTDRPSS